MRNTIPATLIMIYEEINNNDSKVEVFRVKRNVSLIIEPREGQRIRLGKDDIFHVDKVEQNIKENTIYLYDTRCIPFYEYYGRYDDLKEEKLAPILQRGWKLVTDEVEFLEEKDMLVDE